MGNEKINDDHKCVVIQLNEYNCMKMNDYNWKCVINTCISLVDVMGSSPPVQWEGNFRVSKV